MLQDLRFGLRLLRRHPVPVGISIGGLALAIGVVTSVFSLVNAAMLRPYGMDEPSSVVSVTRPIDHRMWSYWPYEQFLRMQAETTRSTVEAALPERVRFSGAPAADGGRCPGWRRPRQGGELALHFSGLTGSGAARPAASIGPRVNPVHWDREQPAPHGPPGETQGKRGDPSRRLAA